MFTNVKNTNMVIANNEKKPKPINQYIILHIIIRVMKVIPNRLNSINLSCFNSK